MKNVLLIGSELGKGGAERSISLLSFYLEPYYNVTLCILSGTDREKFYKTCSNVVFIDPPAAKNIFQKVNAWKYRLKKIRQLKKQLDIDVSISFLEGPDYINVLTKGKEKVVLSIRGSKVHDKVIAGVMGRIRKKILIPRLYKKADKIVCVTHALTNELKQHFNIRKDALKTIYNFYEEDEIAEKSLDPLTEEEQKIFSKPVIITSGRLHIAKEQDKLIDVFSHVKQKNDARLMILGDGEMKEQLISLCNKLKLTICDWKLQQRFCDADVYFMGFQPNAFKFYKHSALFALSSSWEGFPNVLAEALICRIPVVSTDCHTGPREILNIDGLPDEPVSMTVRTNAGSLLPLLQKPTDRIIRMWTEEILYWLNAAPPLATEFQDLTERFGQEGMLQQWKEVIEK